jgi:hypothetical protein
MIKTILEAIRKLLQAGKQICVRVTPHAMTHWVKVKDLAVFSVSWAVSYKDANAALRDIMQLSIEANAEAAFQISQTTIGELLNVFSSFLVDAILPCIIQHFAGDWLSTLAFTVACFDTIKHTWRSGIFAKNLVKLAWMAVQKWIGPVN